MRSRWIHVPRLHTALHRKDGEEMKVSWLELLYDLVFVASIIQLGDALARNISVEGFLFFAGHILPLWIAWTGFSYYGNRFEVDDLAHRLLVFVQLLAVGAMGLAAPQAMEGNGGVFAVGYGVAQLTLAVMYARAYTQVPKARDYARYWGTVFTIGAGLWIASVFVPAEIRYALWTLGVLGVLFAPVGKQSRLLSERFPSDMDHLSERYGLLTMIVLGESFLKVLTHVAQDGFGADPAEIFKGSIHLVLTCSLWWIYFDDVGGSKIRKDRGGWVVWLYAHIPLIIALTGVGVASRLALRFDFTQTSPEAERWLLCGTVSLVLAAVALIDSVTERRQADLSDRARVSVRATSALVVLILGQAGESMSAGLFVGSVVAVCVVQVAFDLMMSPIADMHSGVDAVSTAELARQHAAGQRDAASIRPDPSRVGGAAIRRGAPSELRRDLYFFFLEGSWTRLFMALAFVYVVTNILFAGLYLLDPESIRGGQRMDFAQAFFFSVQTMSTIGYGALRPASEYGNLVVTLEAAVGILGAALVTGLMFAKVSRPRAGVMFSAPIILTRRNGNPALVFRVGNARGNDIVDATLHLGVLMEELTSEGHHMRRLHDLKLLRERNPMFVLSWTAIHEIDESSPLFGLNLDTLENEVILLVATLLGHDGTYGQTTYTRQVYQPESIVKGRKFVDVISQTPDGRLEIDYSKFHDTEPDPAADP